jgi:hypothetical protein
MRRSVLLALALSACGGKPAAAPKSTLPPLDTRSLPAVAQGPGARWAAIARPKDLFEGPLAAPLGLVLPKQGLDRLSTSIGFDVRKADDALVARYGEATLYLARMPVGSSPQLALDAFERRIMQPSGRASPRPDVVRAWGSLPSGDRSSEAALWSPNGDVIAGESGRFGPVNVTIALATGQLAKTRGLAETAPYATLLAWAAGAPLTIVARCPISDVVSRGDGEAGEPPAITEECDGAALTARALSEGRLEIRAHVEGRWGGDASLVEKEARAIVARIVASEIGRGLGLADAALEYASNERAIDVRAVLDAKTFAERLRKLTSADLPEVMR